MSNLHEVRTVRCAACGRLCQETSHWFVARVEDGSFLCKPLPAHGHQRPERALRKNQDPLCGQHCAQKLFERYLAGEMMRRRLDANSRTDGFSLSAPPPQYAQKRRVLPSQLAKTGQAGNPGLGTPALGIE